MTDSANTTTAPDADPSAYDLYREWRAMQLRHELAYIEHEGDSDDLMLDRIKPLLERQCEIERAMADVANVDGLDDLLALFDMAQAIVREGGTDDRREQRILGRFRTELVGILGRREFADKTAAA